MKKVKKKNPAELKKNPTLFLQEKARELRTEEGLSQRFVSTAIGMHYASYSHLEAGTQGIKFETLVKLRDFYNKDRGRSITLDYLMTGQHPPIINELERTIALLRKELAETKDKLASEQEQIKKLTNTVVALSSKFTSEDESKKDEKGRKNR